MSFILDALRKSEGERQREAAPTLSQVPVAVTRTGLPQWVWLVIGALSLSVLVLGGAWWRSAQTPDPAVMATDSPTDPAPALPPPARMPAVDEPRSEAPPALAGPAAAGVGAARNGPVAAAADPLRTLPSVAEARAAGIALPPLELQLLSYSEDSGERFVFINGFQYRQGQRVQNGPLIVTIYPEGVVLKQEGRDFVLLPD